MLTNGTLCPVDVFQEENTIRMIQQNLGTHGNFLVFSYFFCFYLYLVNNIFYIKTLGILTMNVAISREDDENFLKNVS